MTMLSTFQPVDVQSAGGSKALIPSILVRNLEEEGPAGKPGGFQDKQVTSQAHRGNFRNGNSAPWG